MLKYAILGPIELSDGERSLPAAGPRQLVLLAFVLVHANRAVSTDRLIHALWGSAESGGCAAEPARRDLATAQDT